MPAKEKDMKLNGRPRSDFFTAELLQPYIQRLLDDPSALITSHSHRLVKGEEAPPRRGIFRLTGTANSGDDHEVSWSMYTKIAPHAPGRAQEAVFYESELAEAMTLYDPDETWTPAQ